MTEFAKYIEGLKAKLGLKNDSQLSFLIGVSPRAIYNITKGHSIPTDDICLKLAELAGDDPEKVLLLAHKSKASERSKPYWDKILKAVVNMSLILMLTLPLYAHAQDTQRPITQDILCKIRLDRKRRRWLTNRERRRFLFIFLLPGVFAKYGDVSGKIRKPG